jgi:hypothetical protein
VSSAPFRVVLVVALAAKSLSAQSPAPKPVFVQSYPKGTARIAESNIVVNLTDQKPTFETHIKDVEGSDRGLLSFAPQTVDDQDLRIVAWNAKLADLQRKYLGNLLLATEPKQPMSDRADDQAWGLSVNPYAAVPLLARRVFRVEDFYRVRQAKEPGLLTSERHLLESIRVEWAFTGKNPLGN